MNTAAGQNLNLITILFLQPCDDVNTLLGFGLSAAGQNAICFPCDQLTESHIPIHSAVKRPVKDKFFADAPDQSFSGFVPR